MSDSIMLRFPVLINRLMLEDQHFKPNPSSLVLETLVEGLQHPGIEQTSNLNLNMNEISLKILYDHRQRAKIRFRYDRICLDYEAAG